MNKNTFWAIVILVHSVFFVKQVFFEHSIIKDGIEYLFAADNLVKNHTLYAWDLNDQYNVKWLTKRPFLYPSILAFFKLLSFNQPSLFVFLTLLIQNAISLLCLLLAFKTLSNLNYKLNYNLALLFIIITPAQAIYANLIMTEIWLQYCLISMLYIHFNPQYSAVKKLTLLGLCIIAAMALKPVMAPFAFIFPLYYLFIKQKKLIPLLFLPLLFYFGSNYINLKRTGYFHYSSISTINLLQYNTYLTIMNKHGIVYADSVVDKITDDSKQLNSYKEEQAYRQKECKKIITDNLGLYAYLHLKGMLVSFIDPGRFDITQFFNLKHNEILMYETNTGNKFEKLKKIFLSPIGSVLILLILANIFKAIFYLKYLFSSPLFNIQKIALIILPAYIITLTGIIGTSRFLIPLFPILLIIFLISTKKKT